MTDYVDSLASGVHSALAQSALAQSVGDNLEAARVVRRGSGRTSLVAYRQRFLGVPSH